MNPLYTLCIPKQTATPQVPANLREDQLMSEEDPFSNLLIFNRTNQALPHSSGSHGTTPTDFSAGSRAWTTFD